MTTDERLARLERALAQLASGLDWSYQRGGRSRAELNEICAELQAATDAEALKLRQAALETELASLRAA
jgi:hypothetical protein